MKNKKAQTTVVLIVIVLIIFFGMVIFLLSFAETVSKVDSMNMYVGSLLLSILRTDTGYIGSDCRQISDAIGCAFFKAGHRCDGTGPTCFDLANQRMHDLTNMFGTIRENYDYLFIAEVEGAIVRGPDGVPIKFTFGNESLEMADIEKIVQTEYLFQDTGYRQYILKVQLIVTKK